MCVRVCCFERRFGVVGLAGATDGDDETAGRRVEREEIVTEHLAQLIFAGQPHHLIGFHQSSAHSTVPLKWKRDSPPATTSSTTMSLTVNTDSAISGRGMKNTSPLAGVHETCGASRTARSREITGAVWRAEQKQRQCTLISSGPLGVSSGARCFPVPHRLEDVTDAPRPGWYPDPAGASGLYRWWDGNQWAEVTSDSVHAPPPVPVPAEAPPVVSPGHDARRRSGSQLPSPSALRCLSARR